MQDKDFNKEEIVVEIREMIDDIDSFKETMDNYCQFLKHMFLSGSGKN